MGDFFKFLTQLDQEIKKKGVKGIIPIFSIIILGILYISPAYMFMFFYQRTILLSFPIVISILAIIVLDTMLFLVLFFLCSLTSLVVKENGVISAEHCKISKSVIRSILCMGVISAIFCIVNYISIVCDGEEKLKSGATVFLYIIGFILSISVIRFLLMEVVSISLRVKKKMNNKD